MRAAPDVTCQVGILSRGQPEPPLFPCCTTADTTTTTFLVGGWFVILVLWYCVFACLTFCQFKPLP